MAYLSRESGHQVYYESHGEGSRALLLVHGWGMSGRVWDTVLPDLLGPARRVVVMDHRGCGRSDRDFDDLGINAIAGDVAALVEKLSLDSVVLNGWSLGGAVVVEAAHRLGSRCAGLVLTCGATPIYTQKPDLPLGGTDEDVKGVLAAMSSDRVNFLHGLSQAVCAKPVGEPVERWLWQIFLEASPQAASTLGELAALDQRSILTGLDMPILTYVGSEDGFVAPPIGRWLGENHPNTMTVEMKGVGHAPFIEEREQYVGALVDFLAALKKDGRDWA